MIYKILRSMLVGALLTLLSASAINAQEVSVPTAGTTIMLDGSTASISGQGVSVNNNVITITAAGTYGVSGTLSDGQLVVDTDADGTVMLILNGATIHSTTSAPIYIKEANNAIIYLAEGSENVMSDGTEYVYEDPEDDEPNAAVFSDDALTIDGLGTLTIEANFNDGLASKDTLTILNGVINVTALDDGIRGKDSLTINGGTVNVTAKGDGLKSDNEDDTALGFIEINGGTFAVQAAGDAVQATTTLTINAGDFVLTSGGGSSATLSEDESAKGLKADVGVVTNGGTFALDSADDAIHSNTSIVINAGTFLIASGDDAIHADASIEINDGDIDMTKSYEGIESALITINNGNIHLVSSDDGVNVAGGNDGSGMVGGPGQDGFAASGDYLLTINGGTLIVDASGDGLDANGSIEMTGGLVIVNGPTQNMNGSLDYDGQFTLTGGQIVAAGSAGMAQSPDSTSSQPSLLINFTSSFPAGTLIHIESASGESVLTFAPTKTFQSLAFSSPALTVGESYTVYTGGSSDGTAVAGLYEGGTYTSGTSYTTLTLSGVVTQVGESRGGGRGRR